MTQFGIATLMVLVAAALVGSFLWYKARSSERRMMRMLQRCGVDPQIARQQDHGTIMQQVRARCRRCQSEGPCESWLAGRASGSNEFCPNAKVFEDLAHLART